MSSDNPDAIIQQYMSSDDLEGDDVIDDNEILNEPGKSIQKLPSRLNLAMEAASGSIDQIDE